MLNFAPLILPAVPPQAPEMRSLPEPLFSDGADGGAVEGGGTD
jgi:hypothetical protein